MRTALALASMAAPRIIRALSSSSSSFQPPIPPTSAAQSIYENIDFGKKLSNKNAQQRNADPDAVFVINGSSRGIGLQFVKSLLDRTEGKIVACCRTPQNYDSQLNNFLRSSADSDRVTVLPLDVEDQSQIERLATTLRQDYQRVDALFNVAGVLGDSINTPGPERALQKLDRSWLEKSMAVNVIGPMMVSQALAPLMEQRRNPKQPQDMRPPAIIANLSARVGSISDNNLGGWYSYRASKAALNQATRCMALELKRKHVWTVALHPGTTQTDLSLPFSKNVQEGRMFPVDFTVERLLSVVECMEEEHSGGFFDWAGIALPF